MKLAVVASVDVAEAEIEAADRDHLILTHHELGPCCLRMADGTVLWELELGVAAPSDIVDGRALAIANEAKQLHAYDVRSGDRVWSRDIRRLSYWRIGRELVVPSPIERELQFIEVQRGAVTRKLILPQPHVLAVTGDVVVTSDAVGKGDGVRTPIDPCCGVDVEQRKVLWERPLLPAWQRLMQVEQPRFPKIAGTVRDRVILFGDGHVAALHAATGELTSMLVEPTATDVFCHDDRVWVARSRTRGLLCIDPVSGQSQHLTTRGDSPIVTGFFGPYVMVAVTKYLDFYHREFGAERVPFKQSSQQVMGQPPYLALQELNQIRILRVER